MTMKADALLDVRCFVALSADSSDVMTAVDVKSYWRFPQEMDCPRATNKQFLINGRKQRTPFVAWQVIFMGVTSYLNRPYF